MAAALILMMAAPLGAQSYSDGFSFMKAVKDRDGTKVQELISSPGSIVINTKERSGGDGALHILTRDRDLVWLNYLLGRGARPDLQNNQGETALSLAAQMGWVEGAQILLNRRANVDLPNNRGETPLIKAVHKRDVAMVRLLLSKGASPTRTDNAAGYSALDYARRDTRAAPILRLLEAKPAPTKPVFGPTR